MSGVFVAFFPFSFLFCLVISESLGVLCVLAVFSLLRVLIFASYLLVSFIASYYCCRSWATCFN